MTEAVDFYSILNVMCSNTDTQISVPIDVLTIIDSTVDLEGMHETKVS